jgi:hypothetical protein
MSALSDCRKQLAACQTKLTVANQQVTDLTTQLADCEGVSSSLQAQLEAANITAENLLAQVTDLQKQLDDCLHPPKPVAGCVLGSTTIVKNQLGLAGHSYASWDSDPTNPADSRAYIEPGTRFYNVKFAPFSGWVKGQNALWEEIASGSEDARIDEWAAMLMQISNRMAIALHHEPIPDQGTTPHEGDPSILAAATHRVIQRWRDAGVTHLLGQCLLSNQFTQFPTMLVTDACDFVGVDAYGGAPDRFTADAAFSKVEAYRAGTGKPLVIFETNFHNAVDGDGQQDTFYNSLDSFLKADPTRIACATYHGAGPFDNDLNSEGLAVMTRMASDPYYTRGF